MNKGVLALGTLVAGLLLTGSLLGQDHAMHGQAAPTPVTRAVAVLHPTAGNQTAGTVTFTQEGAQVRVVAAVTGLKAGARHGFHLHELGDCSAPDAASAGPHRR